MQAAKLNVFHWHLTDTQSWPLQLKSLPLASARAAYDPVEAVYSAADIATVVDAARRRGIRVIPEVRARANKRKENGLGFGPLFALHQTERNLVCECITEPECSEKQRRASTSRRHVARGQPQPPSA